MSRFHEEIDGKLRRFIEAQPIFFVATAAPTGRINVSPKGLADTLCVLGPRRVAYLDLTGSGNETAAHLAHDGRMTMMMCAFDRAPRILRLYGRGTVVQRGDKRYPALRLQFACELPGERQIVVLDVDSIQTSCGYSVPRMELVEERTTLVDWAERKGEVALSDYRRQKNRTSIDGLEVAIVDDLAPPASDVD